MPLYSPTDESHSSTGPEEARILHWLFQLDGAADFVNTLKISASTPALPVVAPVNAQATQDRPVTSVRNESLSTEKPKQDTNMEKDGRLAADGAGRPKHTYGRNGGQNTGNRGNWRTAANPTAYQMLQQQQQHYQAYAAAAPTVGNGGSNSMSPLFLFSLSFLDGSS